MEFDNDGARQRASEATRMTLSTIDMATTTTPMTSHNPTIRALPRNDGMTHDDGGRQRELEATQTIIRKNERSPWQRWALSRQGYKDDRYGGGY